MVSSLAMILPVKVLLVAPSCGTLVVSTFRITTPLEPPPVRSVPAVTPRIGPPPPLTEAHVQPELVDCKNWLLGQVCTASGTLPLAPPPERPAPAVTPVIV